MKSFPFGNNGSAPGILPKNYTPWRDLFLQLRKVRPWGPSDRISPENRDYFESMVDGAPDKEALARVEIELVFRTDAAAAQIAESEIGQRINAIGGVVVHRSLRSEFAYHALLADIPAAEVRRMAALDLASLAGADPIASIVPQSVGTPLDVADRLPADIARPVCTKPGANRSHFQFCSNAGSPAFSGQIEY